MAVRPVCWRSRCRGASKAKKNAAFNRRAIAGAQARQ